MGERWHEVTVGEQADVPGASMLVMHDPEDPDTPFATSLTLAQLRPNTRLVEPSGLGHYRPLNDQATVDAVVAFLSSVVAAGPKRGKMDSSPRPG